MCNCGTSKCACGIWLVEQIKGIIPWYSCCGTMPVWRSQWSLWKGVGRCRVQPNELHTPRTKHWGNALNSGLVSICPYPTLNNSKCVHNQTIKCTMVSSTFIQKLCFIIQLLLFRKTAGYAVGHSQVAILCSFCELWPYTQIASRVYRKVAAKSP